jgi:hypothetical protein
MIFKVLDLEKEIEEQGFVLEAFDVITAGRIIYAIKNLAATLQNVRRHRS